MRIPPIPKPGNDPSHLQKRGSSSLRGCFFVRASSWWLSMVMASKNRKTIKVGYKHNKLYLIVAYLWFRSKAWTVQYIPYCTVVSAIYGYCTVVALITTHCLLSPCTCVLSYKPVNTPQAGLYEYNALVRNHKYIQPSGFALVLYVLVVTHSCIILHTAQLGVY